MTIDQVIVELAALLAAEESELIVFLAPLPLELDLDDETPSSEKIRQYKNWLDEQG